MKKLMKKTEMSYETVVAYCINCYCYVCSAKLCKQLYGYDGYVGNLARSNRDGGTATKRG